MKLSKDEVLYLRGYASQRNESKDPSWTRRKSDQYTDLQVDLMGLCGEYVASLALNADVDLAISSSGDPGHDLLVDFSHRRQVPVGVKFNHRLNGYLIVEPNRKDSEEKMYDFRSDLVVLVSGVCRPKSGFCTCSPDLIHEQDFHLAGWITRDRFMSIRTPVNWGLGDRWYVRQSDLNPISSLRKWLL